MRRTLSSLLVSPLLALACTGLLLPPAAAKRAPTYLLVQTPILEQASPNEVAQMWHRLRDLSLSWINHPERAQKLKPELDEARRFRCEGLVSLTALASQGLMQGFGRRDLVRQRDYARPTLALLLHESMQRFRASLPSSRSSSRLISIGDVSQIGCGPLRHGVLVHEMPTPEAQAHFANSQAYNGRYTLHERLNSLAFPQELDRFGLEQTLVREQVLVAQNAQLSRIEIRRFRVHPLDLKDTPDSLVEEALKALKQHPQTPEHLPHTYEGSLNGFYRFTVSLPKGSRRVVLLSAAPSPTLETLVEVRLSNWPPNQPASAPREQRWVRLNPASSPGPQWEHWELVNEAGHASHLSGIDADLSYVTREDTRHFAIDLPQMDPVLTWRWLETLEATARELKTPLEAIFVDKVVKRHLTKKVPKKLQRTPSGKRVAALLKVSPGHDAHHHIRITPGTDTQEADALKRLGLTP